MGEANFWQDILTTVFNINNHDSLATTALSLRK